MSRVRLRGLKRGGGEEATKRERRGGVSFEIGSISIEKFEFFILEKKIPSLNFFVIVRNRFQFQFQKFIWIEKYL